MYIQTKKYFTRNNIKLNKISKINYYKKDKYFIYDLISDDHSSFLVLINKAIFLKFKFIIELYIILKII